MVNWNHSSRYYIHNGVENMKTRAAFDIQNYLVTVLLFMGIMVTFGTVAYNMGQNYETIGGSEISSEFKDTYNNLNIIESETAELQDKLVETQTGTDDADSQFLGDALNSLKLIIPSLTASTTMIREMSTSIGIPVLWQRIFTLILIIMILTVILYMIFKSRGTN